MDENMFSGLLPILKRTSLAYLQGWGEPLLNPAFFQFVQMAKAVGCRVGTTTNGTLLDEKACLRLVGVRLDLLAFSLAGVDDNNDRIRQGTSLSQVVAAIDLINRIKEESGSGQPDIHIAYMLLRSRLDDLDGLPELLAGKRVSQVVVSTLDFIGDRSFACESFREADKTEYESLRIRLERVSALGRKAGISFHFHVPGPDDRQKSSRHADYDSAFSLAQPAEGLCPENIQHAAFISAGGSVSPCVYVNLPFNGEIMHFSNGMKQIYQPMVFGNLSENSFSSIWNSKKYSAFRESHRKGNYPPLCRDCTRAKMHSICP